MVSKLYGVLCIYDYDVDDDDRVDCDVMTMMIVTMMFMIIFPHLSYKILIF